MSKFKVGDNVILRGNLLHLKWYGDLFWHENKETLRNSPYVEIDSLDVNGDYNVKDSTGRDHLISDQMIAGLYEEDETKYLWASDEYVIGDYKCIRFIIKGNTTRTHDVNSCLHQEVLKGEHSAFLMTELEAKKHHLFKSMNRIEVQKEDVQKEELYFIRPFDCEQQHLIELGGGYLFVGDKDHYVNSEARKHFTKEECNKIIGTSTILHKVLVE